LAITDWLALWLKLNMDKMNVLFLGKAKLSLCLIKHTTKMYPLPNTIEQGTENTGGVQIKCSWQ
jgi:hypothetical protein